MSDCELSLSTYLQPVISCAREAGEIILTHYKNDDLKVKIKTDNSPVTAADEAAHHHIHNYLSKLEKFPIISEEGDLSGSFKDTSEPYWLVDPLDGTKEFIAQTDEFTVNIALIQNHIPLLGVIHLPVFNKSYYAIKGEGAFKISEDGETSKLSCKPFDPQDFTLLISRRHHAEDLEQFKAQWPGVSVRPIGSSYKFCQIAEGIADLYVRKGPTHIWDTGAGHCILSEAGGKVVIEGNNALTYKLSQMINPSFWAIGDKLASEQFL
ncbi:MAG: 3'(2'),5'-bisphosphate nucleotidase CysQ [Oligoflexales bacterium]|nr:3'(2'),5'-bisphosphate nucleotidase CysQ [Oligoflexales bacterium]